MLPRLVRLKFPYMLGVDITAHKRAIYRFLGDTYSWKKLMVAAPITRRTYGPFFDRSVNKARKRLGLDEDEGINNELFQTLRNADAYLAYEDSLLHRWAAAHPTITGCHPIGKGHAFTLCQGLHQTAGLPGNWAIDLCAKPWTEIVAVEHGVIDRLSGRDPSADVPDSAGVFGYSVHWSSRTNRYFVTHLGTRPPGLIPGRKVEPGTLLGVVGDQDFRPDHVHYGCSSSLGERTAKRTILAVLDAPRVEAR